MAAEQRRVGAAAGEGPFAGDPIAAGRGGCLALDAGTPGEDGIGRPKQAPRNLGLQAGGRHRAARSLAQAPGRARVRTGDHLDHLRQGLQVQLVAAKGTRQQQPKQPCLMQRRDDIGRERPPGLDPIRGSA